MLHLLKANLIIANFHNQPAAHLDISKYVLIDNNMVHNSSDHGSAD